MTQTTVPAHEIHLDDATNAAASTWPCPPMCDEPPGHDFEFGPTGALVRYHERTFEALTAGAPYLVVTELLVPGQPCRFAAPFIAVGGFDLEGKQLTATQARSLATALLAAADACDAAPALDTAAAAA